MVLLDFSMVFIDLPKVFSDLDVQPHNTALELVDSPPPPPPLLYRTETSNN
jgi:hypothetical protein